MLRRPKKYVDFSKRFSSQLSKMLWNANNPLTIPKSHHILCFFKIYVMAQIVFSISQQLSFFRYKFKLMEKFQIETEYGTVWIQNASTSAPFTKILC